MIVKGKTIIENTLLSNKNNLEILIYFPTSLNSYYQLAQWLPPLLELDKKYKIAIIVREMSVFIKLSNQSELPIIYIQTLDKLKKIYTLITPSIILYVSNAQKNTQSLLYKKGFHVYLNHGESEKECMSSNQSKAYDYIFTVGQRGLDRYKENLLNFDEKKYLIIGRPQLDFINTVTINSNNNQKIILYAPTWEAHYEEMDYCSIEKYGLTLVKKIINNPRYILIYKPHPAIGTKRKSVKVVHKKIISLINNNTHAHYCNNIDINTIFSSIDFAFIDNSSIIIDYLFFNKPGAYISIRDDIQVHNLLKIYAEFSYYQEKTLTTFIESTIKSYKEKRREIHKIKKYYLGNFSKGESTKKLIDTVGALIDERNKQLLTKNHSKCPQTTQ